jgi:glutamate-ammonia-ligase adenylyltransferase
VSLGIGRPEERAVSKDLSGGASTTGDGAAPAIPAVLAAEAERAWQALEAAVASNGGTPVWLSRHGERLRHLFACSPFAAMVCAREPETLRALVEDGSLAALPAALEDEASDGNAFAAALRQHRRRRMLAIVWRAVAENADPVDVMDETTQLADTAIRLAVHRAEQELSRRFGVPRDAGGRPQRLVTLAMGKLGGRELNFSSDVDLIFLFPSAGETDGRRALSNEEFFTRVTRRVVSLLDERSAEGFVFRVDTRLRPFGASGSPVHSLAALEAYLQGHARAWERYAYVRARPVTGSEGDREAVMALLHPFVYRRYLDFGVLDSVREIRSLIGAEVQRRERHDDLKLGPGGIREVEFIVQTFQVLHGGRDRTLRLTGTLAVLERLVERGLLDPPAGERLRDAYRFLRRAENAVQMVRDEQTHELPTDAAERARLACHLGFSDWPALAQRLAAFRQIVSAEFDRAVVAGDSCPADGIAEACRAEADTASAAERLASAGVPEPTGALELLARLRESRWYTRLTQVARERLERLLPLLLGAVAREEADLDTLRRTIAVLEAVGSRSAYFALLAENRQALDHLLKLCRLGPVVADHLVRSPALIDELIDPTLFSELPSRDRLRRDLEQRLAGLDPDDAEAWMDALRRFHQSAVFQVAVGDLLGQLPVSPVSDLLTDVAELLLEETLEMAQRQLASRHGRPRRDGAEVPFAIVAYGKLGGFELGYASDLDLVFLHASGDGATDGRQPLENPVYFMRLAQRVIHLLSTPTAAGILYQVDTRLRPSGNAGLLVSSLEAFADYQHREAWTWEHQALLRARAVAGDAALREAFEAVRRDVLCQPRDPAALREDVVAMRERMRRELTVAAPGCFDIKQDSGGLVDVEFLVQFLILANAHDHPRLVEERGNARQLRALTECGLIPSQTAQSLTAAYYELRRLAHHASLRGERAVTPADAAREAAAVVSRAFDELVARSGGGA